MSTCQQLPELVFPEVIGASHGLVDKRMTCRLSDVTWGGLLDEQTEFTALNHEDE